MTTESTRTRILLLVEDNPGDAELVKDMLVESGEDLYQVVHVSRVADAVEALARKENPVDVVVVDLQLPDCEGVDTVRAIRAVADLTPIVVLTGSDDEALASQCIDAGAQDYLAKAEVRAHNLRRTIGYAITRVREAQLRQLQETLAQYRAMSSATQTTSVTATLAGSGAMYLRNPRPFAQLVDDYFELLVPYLTYAIDHVVAPRASKERIITYLGDSGGGPRDLLDVHVAALDLTLARFTNSRARLIVFESRLLALEMMGLLVDFYRVGHQRRFAEGAMS